jgi:hypothetical protein
VAFKVFFFSFSISKNAAGRARKLIQAAWFISAVFSFPLVFLYEEKIVQGTIIIDNQSIKSINTSFSLIQIVYNVG